MESSAVKQLLSIIEQQLDWGESSRWQGKDFELLNQLILDKTKVSLSASTLRRLWGRVEYNHLPSSTTLDTLAKFAGFDNWRAFARKASPTRETTSAPAARTGKYRKTWRSAALLIIAVAMISLVAMYVRKPGPIVKGVFSFSSRPVTRSIPNSVIFDYDARVNPSDSVFIQQSWDPTTRSVVDKARHTFTSVYYRPGFYHAKLLVNNKIVKEHTLMIPTDGWLALIANQPIPVYLDTKEFIGDGVMNVTPATITKKNIPLGPQPPVTELYNVGNFAPVPLKNFSFSVQIKNDFHDGAAACEFINIMLFTDNSPVIIPLSAKGCISNLALLNGRYFESGKDHDLSGFGSDLSQWVKVDCRSAKDKIQYYVNNKLVYQSQLPPYDENIVGMGYTFQGTGSVKNITLKQGDKLIFQAY
ncbi:hypothetical protein [Mucilaginibacter ginsenosidivorans]|uniref:PKD domain-containing protein n=1 Tax=Mucilaginibacter ginsenosidivorans TaxID=398053 RepID=A0A5B8UWZ0_9SPHI|nr:hypothetical protein [Mucilaginibacter ginsenosidivorans]QEC63493.1 hypothetical protein FRZ54_13195 [Mucilaginibacter ginsenosidivorans]